MYISEGSVCDNQGHIYFNFVLNEGLYVRVQYGSMFCIIVYCYFVPNLLIEQLALFVSYPSDTVCVVANIIR